MLLVPGMYKEETGYVGVLCNLMLTVWINGSNITLGFTIHLSLYIIEYIVVFWLSDIVISATAQWDGSYKKNVII